MTRDQAEAAVWLMTLVIVMIIAVVALICIAHTIWWGLFADLALAGTLAVYAHFYDRARKRRKDG